MTESSYGCCNASCYYNYYYYGKTSSCRYRVYYDCGDYTAGRYYYSLNYETPDPNCLGSCPDPSECGLSEGSLYGIIFGSLFLLICIFCLCSCCSSKQRSSSAAARNLENAQQEQQLRGTVVGSAVEPTEALLLH